MDRRAFLASSGVALPFPLSGCLESTADPSNSGDESGDDPDENGGSTTSTLNPNKWHLCEGIATEPSLDFESRYAVRGVDLSDGLSYQMGSYRIYTTIIAEESELDKHEITADHIREFIGETNFETQALLAVQYGITSSSNMPRVARIEETDDGIHAFGCVADPDSITLDAAIVTVVARFEQPERAIQTTRVTFVTPWGEVTIAPEDGVVKINE